MLPVRWGLGAQVLASPSERDSGLAWVQSPHVSGGPLGLRLGAESEGAFPGPDKPTRTWPPHLCANFTGWGGLMRSPCLPGPPGPRAARPRDARQSPGALGARVTGPRWAGVPVCGGSTLSCNSLHFPGASSWDFPLPRLSWPPGPKVRWAKGFGFFLWPPPVLGAGPDPRREPGRRPVAGAVRA